MTHAKRILPRRTRSSATGSKTSQRTSPVPAPDAGIDSFKKFVSSTKSNSTVI